MNTTTPYIHMKNYAGTPQTPPKTYTYQFSAGCKTPKSVPPIDRCTPHSLQYYLQQLLLINTDEQDPSISPLPCLSLPLPISRKEETVARSADGPPEHCCVTQARQRRKVLHHLTHPKRLNESSSPEHEKIVTSRDK